MAEWPKLAFADLIRDGVLEIGDGYRAKNEELGGDGPIFLRAGLVQDAGIDLAKAERFRLERVPALMGKTSRAGDVLVTTKGNSTGRVAYVSESFPEVVYSPHLSYWRSLDTTRLLPGYLRYWSRSRDFTVQLAAMAVSTDMAPYLSLTDQRRLTLPLPPVTEQRRTARLLGALDDQIELNRRTSETLEATARALFKFWFLDSETDTSDQDGSLADAVDLLRDLVDPQLEPDTVFRHYSLPAYDAGREAVSEPGAGIRSSKLAVPRGSVLLSKLNPEIERVWAPDIRPDDRAICSTEFLVLRPRVGVGRAFVYEFLRSTPFRNTLTSLVTGTTGSHQRAHAESILQVPLRLPGSSRASQFERLVGPMLDRIAVARRESRALVALRDALLPRLLSGEASPPLAGGN